MVTLISKQKKSYRKKPHARHLLLLKKISENLGKGMSMSQAMKEAGYSESYSKSPDQIAKTKSWQLLLEEYLPDDLLAKTHKGLILHKDWRVRDAGLDKAYKLKRKYGDIDLNIRLGELSDREVEDAIAGEISAALGVIEGAGSKEEE